MQTSLLSHYKGSLKKASSFFIYLAEITHLTGQTLYALFTRPFYFKKVVEQIYNLGAGSLSITLVIGLTMGVVMTLNFGHGLLKFGGTMYVPAVVSLSLAREMAPLLTSLLIAGRIGSGIAAEIGSMKVSQQVDAIRALGTSPIRILVVPRFLASLISLPLLCGVSFLVGIIGGGLVSLYEFDMPLGFYFQKVTETVTFADYLSGIVKSSIFGGIIAMVGCYQGLRTSGGTRGVGISTTWVVVTSSITILIVNIFISKIFLNFWGGA